MFVIGGAVIGAGLGAYRARKLGGNLADTLQFAVGYGLAFTMLGVIATFVIHRSLV